MSVSSYRIFPGRLRTTVPLGFDFNLGSDFEGSHCAVQVDEEAFMADLTRAQPTRDLQEGKDAALKEHRWRDCVRGLSYCMSIATAEDPREFQNGERLVFGLRKRLDHKKGRDFGY